MLIGTRTRIIVASVVQGFQLQASAGRCMALVDALRGCMAAPPPPLPPAARLSKNAVQQQHLHARPAGAASLRLARDFRTAVMLCDSLTARSHAALHEARGTLAQLERASAEVRAIGAAVDMLVRAPELLHATIRATL